MAKRGGMAAELLTKAIDNIFLEEHRKIWLISHQSKLISLAIEGANVGTEHTSVSCLEKQLKETGLFKFTS